MLRPARLDPRFFVKRGIADESRYDALLGSVVLRAGFLAWDDHAPALPALVATRDTYRVAHPGDMQGRTQHTGSAPVSEGGFHDRRPRRLSVRMDAEFDLDRPRADQRRRHGHALELADQPDRLQDGAGQRGDLVRGDACRRRSQSSPQHGAGRRPDGGRGQVSTFCYRHEILRRLEPCRRPGRQGYDPDDETGRAGVGRQVGQWPAARRGLPARRRQGRGGLDGQQQPVLQRPHPHVRAPGPAWVSSEPAGACPGRPTEHRPCRAARRPRRPWGQGLQPAARPGSGRLQASMPSVSTSSLPCMSRYWM